MKNLLKIEDRWPLQRRLPDLFDDHAELDERLPRQLKIEIFERQVRGQTYVFQRCNSVNIGHRLIRAHVFAADKIHGDDTTVPVLSPRLGRTKTGRLWAYVRDDRPFCGGAAPAVAYS